MDDDVYQEFIQAQKEERQPRCPYCQEPLVIEELWYKVHVWEWDAPARRYGKELVDEGTERPRCSACQEEFYFFINGSELLCDLGLQY